MNLFIFVLIPIATILLSIVLERVLQRPSCVAITIFSIYLIVFFVLFLTGVVTDLAVGLIAVIIYSIISYITALISRFVRCICKRLLRPCCSNCTRTNNEDVLGEDDINCNQDGNLLTISARCNNGNTQDLLSVNSNCLSNELERNNEENLGMVSNTTQIEQNGMEFSGNITNNQINNGRYGRARSCYRR